MTQAVQSFDTTVIASSAMGTEGFDTVQQLARLKCKLQHPAFATDHQRTKLLAQIRELEGEICWSSHEKPATPSGKLPIRRP